jgi:GNAT superfamily N-acetyltransferase
MGNRVARIRAATKKDLPALAEVYGEAWRNAYQGVIPHLALERMIAHRDEQWWARTLAGRGSLLVLDFAGKAAGYTTFGRSRIRRTTLQGEIFELYLHPVYQGLGLGKRLFTGARKSLLDLHYRGLVVWALADNDGACNFYLRLGGKPFAEGAEHYGNTTLRKVAFAWA